MSRSWICDGVPKNAKQYPNQNPPGKHEPYENYGLDCVICSLPQEAMETRSKLSPKTTLAAIVIVTAFLLSTTLYFLTRPKSCPVGQQNVNNVCIAKTPSIPSNSPTSPTITPTVSPVTVSTYVTFAEVPNVPKLKVRYGGSTSFAPLRSKEIVVQIEKAQPGFELIYTEPPYGTKPGSGSGIKMLLEGNLTVAQSSRPVKEKEYEAAKNRSFTLEQIPVAIDGIAFYVNPQVSVPGLTISQIKDIFTGKITNWKKLGGSDLKITPVSRDPEDGGTPEFFQEKVLGGKPFASSIQPYPTNTTASLQKVAKIPGAIGYATASEVCNQQIIRSLPIAKDIGQPFVASCNGRQVNQADFTKDTYPLTRRLFIIIKRDDKLDEQAGVAYVNLLLSDEGQKLVNQVGLVSIRNIP